jgi:hypothetical protein
MAFVGGAQALAVRFIGRCDSAGHTGSGGRLTAIGQPER